MYLAFFFIVVLSLFFFCFKLLLFENSSKIKQTLKRYCYMDEGG